MEPRPAARYVVLVTAPDDSVATRLADLMVRERVAACVNTIPGVSSTYWWEGAIQHDQEVLLIAKTDGHRVGQLVALIEEQHPYDCPEAVAIEIGAGSDAYLRWITDALQT